LISLSDLKSQLFRISEVLLPLESLHIEHKTMDPVRTSLAL
jgi:hypothetical protein